MPLEDPRKGLIRLPARHAEPIPVGGTTSLLPDFNQAGLQHAIARLSAPKEEEEEGGLLKTLRTILQIGAPIASVAFGTRAPLLAGFTSGIAQGMSEKDIREQELAAEEAERTQRAIQRLTEIGFEADLREQGAERRHTRELEEIEARQQAMLDRQKQFDTFKRTAGAAELQFEQDIKTQQLELDKRAEDRRSRKDKADSEKADKIPAPPIARNALSSWAKFQSAKRGLDKLRERLNSAATNADRELAQIEVDKAEQKLDEASLPIMELAETYGLSFNAARGILFDVGRGKINENDLGELLQGILSKQIDPRLLDAHYTPSAGPARITVGDL